MSNNILIIGLGLIGGSIAKSIKKNSSNLNIYGIDNNTDTINYALKNNIIDYDTSFENNLKDFSFIIISSPIATYQNIANKLKNKTSNDCLIIDIGSVKKPVLNIFSKILAPYQIENFLPCHPMAGSEYSGIKAAKDDLFKKKNFLYCLHENFNNDNLKKFDLLINSLKSQAINISADNHDITMAFVSHLVQYKMFEIKKILDNKFSNSQINELKNYKFLRLCFSNRQIWDEIFESNKINLDIALKYYEAAKQNMPDNIKFNNNLNLPKFLLENDKIFKLIIENAYLIKNAPKNYDGNLKIVQSLAGPGFNDVISILEK